MENVLQTDYQDISHLSDADDLETARSEKKEGSLAPSRGASRLDMQTPTGSISSKAGKEWGGRRVRGGDHHRQAVTDQLWMLRVIFLLTLEIIVIIADMIMHEE